MHNYLTLIVHAEPTAGFPLLPFLTNLLSGGRVYLAWAADGKGKREQQPTRQAGISMAPLKVEVAKVIEA